MLKPNLFNQVKIGEAQKFENMTVYPMFSLSDGKVEYITLDEALKMKSVKITEISVSGAVNHIKVENLSDLPILILEGEELIGAKQNRTLNTTVLIKEKSETIIPVSCVEQGRWSYRSREFVKHDFIIPVYVRATKVKSVTKSVKREKTFRSNQAEVWESVFNFMTPFQVESPTEAIDDTYKVIEDKKDEYFNTFKYQEGQNGIIVFINERIAGVEYISLKRAYKNYHDGFIASYILQAIFEKENPRKFSGYKTIDKLISEFNEYKWNVTKSVSLGDDIRFDNNEYVATGLIYQNELIQLSVLNLTRERYMGMDS